MYLHLMFRLALLAAGMLIGISAAAFAQSAADPEKPVTAPDSCSVKIFVHPASVSASRCNARFWSTVDTRA